MRTELETEIDGVIVRGVVSALCWEEMIGEAPFAVWLRELSAGNPVTIRRVLTATMRATGEFKDLALEKRVRSIMEELPIAEVHQHCLALVLHAQDKTEEALGNSRAVVATEAAAEPSSGSTQ